MSFTTHPSARGVARTALSLGTAAALVTTLGAPASFAAPAKANGAERAKAHTTISSLSSAQQKAGFNRFVITYTDSALNAGGINWASPAGTQVATWNDGLYQGLTSEVKSVDDLFKIKTSYVRTTAQKATVVTLSSKLTAEQAEKYMAALSSNPSVASVEPDLLRRSNARTRTAANSKVAQVAQAAQASNQVVAPNDTLYPQQWNLHGTKGLATPEAWKTTQGAGVTVAVIDSGIVKHPTWTLTSCPATTSSPSPPLLVTATAATPTRPTRATGKKRASAVLMQRQASRTGTAPTLPAPSRRL